MTAKFHIIVTSFGRGVISFVRPWNSPYEPPKREPGLGKYFARVGGYLANAERRFAQEHPEVVRYAD